MSIHLAATVLVITATGMLDQPAAAQPRPGGSGPAARVPPGVTAHRDLAYVGDGHERQKLDLFVPETADEPLPLIIWIHGGGWQNGSKEGCPPLRAGFTDRGYAVASLNYRLSGHAVFPAQIEDCKAAIRWLRAHAEEYRLDPKRFGVWGSSAGGHLAALVGTSGDVKAFDVGPHLDQSSRVQAVCDYFGPTDFTVFVTTPGYERHATANSPEAKLIGGPVAANKDKAARASPVTYVSRDDAAFLIVHGDEDPVVPINQSQLLHDALEQAGVDSHFHTIKGGGHGQGFGGAEIEPMVGGFFDRVLKARPPPSNLGPATTSVSDASPATAVAAPPAPNDGPLGVAVADGLTLRDAAREKDLAYKVSYPEGDGPYPLIVFSHGFGGSKDAFSTIARHWAGHGYVVIQPTHADGLGRRAGDRNAAGGRPGRLGAGGLLEGLNDPNRIADRVADLVLILDSLTEIEKTTPGLEGRIDAKRIGVGGHSFGAYTAMLIGGVTVDLGGEQGRSFRDRRVTCILPISAQGTGQQGLTERSWAGLTTPMMTITGTRDRGVGGQDVAWRKEPYRFSPPGSKYLVVIDGANHLSFGGGLGGRESGVTDVVKLTSTLFWDAFLKDSEPARASLRSDAPPKAAGGTYSFEKK